MVVKAFFTGVGIIGTFWGLIRGLKEFQQAFKSDDEKLEKASPDFDAILQGRGNNNVGGYFSVAYLRQELDDKGEVIQTFGQTVTSINQDTKVAKGVFNEKEKKWEAGEEIPKGLWNEMFGDFSARTVHVRIIQTDDRKGIAEILVKKIDDRPARK